MLILTAFVLSQQAIIYTFYWITLAKQVMTELQNNYLVSARISYVSDTEQTVRLAYTAYKMSVLFCQSSLKYRQSNDTPDLSCPYRDVATSQTY